MYLVRKLFVFVVLVSLCSPVFAFGGRWRGGNGNVSYGLTMVAGESNATAQGVANIMARCGRVGHCGGHHPYFEGCGYGATPQAAYNTCCYANSGMTTVDVGYTKGQNGGWFCCRRYR